MNTRSIRHKLLMFLKRKLLSIRAVALLSRSAQHFLMALIIICINCQNCVHRQDIRWIWKAGMTKSRGEQNTKRVLFCLWIRHSMPDTRWQKISIPWYVLIRYGIVRALSLGEQNGCRNMPRQQTVRPEEVCRYRIHITKVYVILVQRDSQSVRHRQLFIVFLIMPIMQWQL